jgi:hypothetical protein
MTDISTLRDALLATVPTDCSAIANHSLLRATLLSRLIPGPFRLPEAEELMEEACA